MDTPAELSPRIQVQPYVPGREAQIVSLLNTAFSGWGDEATWTWKHLRRPGFKPSDILIYADGERLVGCVHLAFQSLTLEPGLTVPYCIEADLAVHPEYRRSGIMLRARDEAKRRIRSEGAVLGLGFAARSMHERIYRQAFGHTAVADGTFRYRKIVSSRQLCLSLQASGEKLAARPIVSRLLLATPLRIGLAVEGFAPCVLRLTRQAAYCARGPVDACDLQICTPYRLLSATRGPRLAAAGQILLALVRGQLQVQGLGRLALRALQGLGNG